MGIRKFTNRQNEKEIVIKVASDTPYSDPMNRMATPTETVYINIADELLKTDGEDGREVLSKIINGEDPIVDIIGYHMRSVEMGAIDVSRLQTMLRLTGGGGTGASVNATVTNGEVIVDNTQLVNGSGYSPDYRSYNGEEKDRDAWTFVFVDPPEGVDSDGKPNTTLTGFPNAIRLRNGDWVQPVKTTEADRNLIKEDFFNSNGVKYQRFRHPETYEYRYISGDYKTELVAKPAKLLALIRGGVVLRILEVRDENNIRERGLGYNSNNPPNIRIVDLAPGTESGRFIGKKAYAVPILGSIMGEIRDIQLTNPGAGYFSVPNVTITPSPTPTGIDASAVAILDNMGGNTIERIDLTSHGSGYDLNNLPVVTIEPPARSTAMLTVTLADGEFDSIMVDDGGEGYTSLSPGDIMVPAPPTAETATAEINTNYQAQSGVLSSHAMAFDITNDGSNYFTAPTVTIDPPVQNAVTATVTAAEAVNGELTRINVTGGSGYLSTSPLPRITVPAPVGGTAATLIVTVNAADGSLDVSIDDGGSGYDSASLPNIIVPDPRPGVTATATATVANGVVTGITINNRGSGYYGNRRPTVTIAAPPPESQARLSAVILNGSITNFIIDDRGSGYINVPTVTIAAPPQGTQAIGTATVIDANGAIVDTKILEQGEGYTTPPDVHVISTPKPTTPAFLTSKLDGSVEKIEIHVGGDAYGTNQTFDSTDPISGFTIGAPDEPTGIQATAIAHTNEMGGFVRIEITNKGSGYETPPIITLPPPITGDQATAYALIKGYVKSIEIDPANPGEGYPEPLEIMNFGGPIDEAHNFFEQKFVEEELSDRDIKVDIKNKGQIHLVMRKTKGFLTTQERAEYAHYDDPTRRGMRFPIYPARPKDPNEDEFRSLTPEQRQRRADGEAEYQRRNNPPPKP